LRRFACHGGQAVFGQQNVKGLGQKGPGAEKTKGDKTYPGIRQGQNVGKERMYKASASLNKPSSIRKSLSPLEGHMLCGTDLRIFSEKTKQFHGKR
jgi:hypothetical protein